jgi:hypothetical protein
LLSTYIDRSNFSLNGDEMSACDYAGGVIHFPPRNSPSVIANQAGNPIDASRRNAGRRLADDTRRAVQ